MVRIDHAELEAFISQIYVDLGATEQIASAVSQSLVTADLSGHHSHGVRLTPTYAQHIAKGDIDPEKRPEVRRENDSWAVVDGQSGFGHICGRKAVEVGAGKAHHTGVSVVGVANAAHLGRIGEWAESATDDGNVFLGFVCNPTSEFVAPPGTSNGQLSTNPIAIGVPSFGALQHPIVLDMATSQVAVGKIREYVARGEPIPEEWTTGFERVDDIERFEQTPGALRPLGGQVAGYKGFGLAVLAELLAGIFSNSAITGQKESAWGNLAMFVQIDPHRFTTPEIIAERIQAFQRHLESVAPESEDGVGPGAHGDEWLLPGRSEYRMRTDQLENGVSIADEDADRLNTLAKECGLGNAIPAAFQDS